ncbi:hypothetical protein Hdeb2414_s0803g00948541 [Helianthus debilis subsp. tardiflorus]
MGYGLLIISMTMLWMVVILLYDLVLFWSWSVFAGMIWYWFGLLFVTTVYCLLIWSCFGVLYDLVLFWSSFGFDLPIKGCKSKGVKWLVYTLWV